MNLQSEITTLKGVGEKSAALFHKLHIFTLRDLLFYFPRDYETFEAPVLIKEVHPGERYTVSGLVTAAPVLRHVRNLKILTLTVKDESGAMQLTFFNMPYLKNTLKPGSRYLFRGMVQERSNHALFIEQPGIYKEADYQNLTRSIQPKYSLTKGISNQSISKAVRQVLSEETIQKALAAGEMLPEEIIRKENLMSYKEALGAIHFPENALQLGEARKRLVFNEFFFFILMLREAKNTAGKEKNRCPMIETAQAGRFLEALPYRLTRAQLSVIKEIGEDMTGEGVMSRLVQGDVGSGKTIVALWALLLCVSNGYQGAMMAPTEVLARQHFETVRELTGKYGLPFKPVLLTGSQPAREKREAYAAIASGEVNLVLGTHAVIQEKVQFANLALVVTDEQHRFGVRQREMLKEKGILPHVLVMSATPIPRTLAIILYGDLSISVIDELPENRKPVKNCVVGPAYRATAYAFMAKEIAAGRQVYCICPIVEEGGSEDLENVEDYTEKLRAALPPSVRIASLHGRMRPSDKNRIMEDFAAGYTDVLVSTTVIEVGINVPNATVMLVENAERFGLAQLHQLRGRVGRGDAQSYCIFINTHETKETQKRLDILNHSNDGFYIASQDLQLRGPGDLGGIRQSGDMQFKLGDIYRDTAILKQAADAVEDYGETMRERGMLPRYEELVKEGILNTVDFTSI